MPHRHAERIEVCQLCDKKAKGNCLRCGISFCKKHVPKSNSRCERCEYSHSLILKEKGLNLPKHRTKMEKARKLSFGMMAAGPLSLVCDFFALGLGIPWASAPLAVLGLILPLSGLLLWISAFWFYMWQQYIDKPLIEPRMLESKRKAEREKFLLETPQSLLLSSPKIVSDST